MNQADKFAGGTVTVVKANGSQVTAGSGHKNCVVVKRAQSAPVVKRNQP